MSVDKQKGPKSESRVISRYDFDTISEGSKRVSKTCVQMAVCDIREGYSPVETYYAWYVEYSTHCSTRYFVVITTRY
jgi:hypothetical protein